MAARSSEFKKSPEKGNSFQISNFSGISFNSKIADVMDQFGNEEFMSASKAANQMMADELSWRKQNATIPTINVNKEPLELSCFSDYISGDVDITVDGGRVSPGKFFQKKCGKFGNISSVSESERPSFGLGNVKSPDRKGQLCPLVDQTVATEGSYLPLNLQNHSSNY